MEIGVIPYDAPEAPSILFLSPAELLAARRDLTYRQRRWYDAFMRGLNATEACRVAGYTGSAATLHQIGYKNTQKPKLARLIEDAINRQAMSQEEAMARMAMLSRADITNFCKFENGGFVLDLSKGIEAGYGIQLREVSQSVETTTRTIYRKEKDPETLEERTVEEVIETTIVQTKAKVHNPKPAIDSLFRVMGLFKDAVQAPQINQANFFISVDKQIFGG